MNVVGRYSFNGGLDVISKRWPGELDEVLRSIAAVDAAAMATKTSREKTMVGRSLFSPKALNAEFKRQFGKWSWKKQRVPCDYPEEYYLPGFTDQVPARGAFREIDFLKNRLGVEVQFGKYAFMVYNVCAKMTIFHNLGFIDAGIEIVPVKRFADRMSTGVSYFEQFVWDLEARGVSDIDIPVLILGIAS